ncbi:MAG: LamG-like jellyroll fold domain-containing protein [Akkermansia sp.]
MKRLFYSLISCAIGLSMSAQASTQLLYSYNFDGMNDSGLTAINHNLSETPGSGVWTKTSGDYLNYSPGVLGSTSAYRSNSGKLTLSSDSSNSLGVNATDGFSLSFSVKDDSIGTYKEMLNITSSTGDTIISKKNSGNATTAGAWEFFNNGTAQSNNIGNWAQATVPLDKYMNIVLTFQNGTLLGYKDGVQFMTATGVNFDGDVKSIQFGKEGSAIFDDVALYSGVLNQGDITYLATNHPKQFSEGGIPEPTTISLGIIGLGLLALRRRRA